MFRTLLGIARAGAKVLLSAAPVRVKSFDRLNVASLVMQAGYAFKKGDPKRAALLLGAASVAPKYRKLSYLVQGAVTLDDLRRRLR